MAMVKVVPLTPGTCEWCGLDCHPESATCSLSCEAQLRRLEAEQGRMVVRELKLWRKHRGRKDTPGQGAISKAAALVDTFLKNDRIRRETAQAKRKREAEPPPVKPTFEDQGSPF